MRAMSCLQSGDARAHAALLLQFAPSFYFYIGNACVGPCLNARVLGFPLGAAADLIRAPRKRGEVFVRLAHKRRIIRINYQCLITWIIRICCGGSASIH